MWWSKKSEPARELQTYRQLYIRYRDGNTLLLHWVDSEGIQRDLAEFAKWFSDTGVGGDVRCHITQDEQVFGCCKQDIQSFTINVVKLQPKEVAQ